MNEPIENENFFSTNLSFLLKLVFIFILFISKGKEFFFFLIPHQVEEYGRRDECVQSIFASMYVDIETMYITEGIPRARKYVWEEEEEEEKY